jgi:hypothetical protein
VPPLQDRARLTSETALALLDGRVAET